MSIKVTAVPDTKSFLPTAETKLKALGYTAEMSISGILLGDGLAINPQNTPTTYGVISTDLFSGCPTVRLALVFTQKDNTATNAELRERIEFLREEVQFSTGIKSGTSLTTCITSDGRWHMALYKVPASKITTFLIEGAHIKLDSSRDACSSAEAFTETVVRYLDHIQSTVAPLAEKYGFNFVRIG